MQGPQLQSTPTLTTRRSTPFWKRIAFRLGGKKSKEPLAVIDSSTGHGRQRSRSMIFIHKPEISSPVTALKMDSSANPAAEDDSSQDASSSANTPTGSRQSRRFSSWDASSPVAANNAVFAAHGPATMFASERTISDGWIRPIGDVHAFSPTSSRISPPSETVGASTAAATSTSAVQDGSAKSGNQTVSDSPNTLISADTVRSSNAVPPPTTSDFDETPRASTDPVSISHGSRTTLAVPPTTPSVTVSAPLDSEEDSTPTPNAASSQNLRVAGSSSSIRPPSPELGNEIQRRRGPAEILSTTLPPPPFRWTSERGLKLSPAVVSRHQPMPILNLPTLPPATPAASADTAPVRPQDRLRSIPSLSIHGRSNAGVESDHYNSTLDYSDEEDDGEGDGDEGEEEDGGVESPIQREDDGQSDDEADSIIQPGSQSRQASFQHVPSPLATTMPKPGLSSGMPTPLAGTGPATATRHGNGHSHAEQTPMGTNVADYFSAKVYQNFVERMPGYSPPPWGGWAKSLPKTPSGHRPTPSRVMPPLPIARPAQTPGTGEDVETPRPIGNLHRVASRSMVDLSATSSSAPRRRKSTRPGTGTSTITGRSAAAAAAAAATVGEMGVPPEDEAGEGSQDGEVASRASMDTAESDEHATELMIGRMMRRQSLPTFNAAMTEPPPYPSFTLPRPSAGASSSHSRDDGIIGTVAHDGTREGTEDLPRYKNDLYLAAVMPRKMEFSAPGVQAKDRKWRRVFCELEGTAFRVYNPPPGASGAGVLGDWWEKRVGVGDLTNPTYTPVKKRGNGKEEEDERTKFGVEMDAQEAAAAGESSSAGVRPDSPQDSRRRRNSSQSSMRSMSPTPRNAKRFSSASLLLAPFRSSMSSSAASAIASSSSTDSSTASASGRTTPTQRSVARLSLLPSSFPPMFPPQQRDPENAWRPDRSEMMREYTLQNAESGLGNDYLKRKNVIRVRLEGEQFLLQAQDVQAVVEWIEALHAGTNIALDLDCRVMPKGPMFPRRRRRRARRTATQQHIVAQSVVTHSSGSSSAATGSS